MKTEWSKKKPETFFVLICLFFGSFFIIVTPSLWGIDEIEHFYRAYQVSNLDFGVHRVDETGYGGKIPHELNRLGQYSKGDLVDNVDSVKIWEKNDYNHDLPYNQLKNHSIKGDLEDAIFSNTAAYSPVGYIPSSTGIGIARLLNLTIGDAINIARFFNLITYIALAYLAIKIVRRKESWLIFVVALLPMMVFQASIVSNDTVINGAALLLFALFIKVYDLYKNDKKLNIITVSMISVALFIICSSKPNYIFLLFIFLLIPAKLFRSKSEHLKVKLIWSAIVVLPVAIWALISSPVSDAIRMFRGSGVANTIDVKSQIELMITHPIGFCAAIIKTFVMYGNSMSQNIIGILGWNYVSMPLLSVVYAYFLITIAALSSKNENMPLKKTLGVFLSLMLVVLSIFFVLYATFNPVGESYVLGVQGRYFLPLLPFLLYIFARLAPISVKIENRYTVPFFTISSTMLLVIGLLYYSISTY